MAHNLLPADLPINLAALSRTVASNDGKRLDTLARRLSHRRRRITRDPHENEQSLEPDACNPSLAANIYWGSYSKSAQNSHQTSGHGSKSSSRRGSLRPSPQTGASHLQLEHLLNGVDIETETFGVDEMRDGFFDALFHSPSKHNHDEMMKKAVESLPVSFKGLKTLSWRQAILFEWMLVQDVYRDITTTRSGIKLLKSFLGFFIAYLICLIPKSGHWLGRYNYILVLSVIINHPGRALGSQIDGALLTILGTAIGLGWGTLALYVSTSTSDVRSGYGGILATFLIFFTVALAWLRCVYLRFYQAVLCAGIAICYTCLADTSESIGWGKIFAYGVPWVLGQAIGLVVSCFVFPSAGTRPLAIVFHSSLEGVQAGLSLPRSDSIVLKRKLARHFVDISQAVRDFTIDLSISRFDPEDIRLLRNVLQGVIRSILAIRPQTTLFNDVEHSPKTNPWDSKHQNLNVPLDPTLLARRTLALPTWRLLETLKEAVSQADSVFMDISGHRTSIGPPKAVSSDVDQVIKDLQERMAEFDNSDDLLQSHRDSLITHSDHPEIIELFLFAHPVRQCADRILSLLRRIAIMQQRNLQYTTRLPSYPFSKSLLRNNAQVRHDRGGLTASFYFRSIAQLNKTMRDLQSRDYVPRPHQQSDVQSLEMDQSHAPSSNGYDVEGHNTLKGKEEERLKMLHHTLWIICHRLQGFESRFALKAILVTTLLSVPAWLSSSRGWWNKNESWWSVMTVWLLMHPRVGGNFQDLFVRTSSAVLGCFWGGIAYGAGGGSPYLMAFFAVLFMVPMLYRFTQSSHPRSGLIACITFTVISLIAYTDDKKSPTVEIAWTRGLAFIVGVISAIMVNMTLWPFIARHELRKSLSTMLLHSAILYRGVVAKYIYYNEGDNPGPEDVAKSEMLEGRLREGLVRIRQLMDLTRHEIRLRAPFDPLPYSALIQCCESFFGHLIEIRQSSLYFQPYMISAEDEKSSSALFTVRRDAVATILMILYVLAGALRSDRPVPRYLPSAAAARQRLLDKMEEVEAKQKRKREGYEMHVGVRGNERRWADVYHFAFSEALGEMVEDMQEMAYFSKAIVGEVGFGAESIAVPFTTVAGRTRR